MDDLEPMEDEKPMYVLTIRNYKVTTKEFLLFGVIVVLAILSLSLVIALAVANHELANSGSVGGQEGDNKGPGGGGEDDGGGDDGGGGSGSVDEICVSQSCLQMAYTMMSNMDETRDPCDDFFQYACDNFPVNNPIYPEFAVSGTVQNMKDEVNAKLQLLLEKPIEHKSEHSWEWKIKNYYQTCMRDFLAEQMKGLFALELIKKIGWNVIDVVEEYNVTDWRDFKSSLKQVQAEYLVSALFHVSVVPSPADASQQVIQIESSGIGMALPLYFGTENELIESTYTGYIAAVSKLLIRDAGLGLDTPGIGSKYANFVNHAYSQELQLAELMSVYASVDEVAMTTVGDLEETYPEFGFASILETLFESAGLLTNDTTVVVLHPTYLSKLNSYIKGMLSLQTGPEAINNYLVWRLAHTYVQELSQEYRDASYAYERTLTGDLEMTSRWRICVQKAINHIPHGLSALWVQNHDISDRIDAAKQIAAYITEALRTQIPTLMWMDDVTKEEALSKIESIEEMIGYGDLFQTDPAIDSYLSDFEVDTHSGFQNHLNWNVHYISTMNIRLSNASEAQDMLHWIGGAYEVEPVYYKVQNTLAMPPAGMQIPLFSKDLPAPVKFGALGVTLARQHTHAIDESGSQYSTNGNMETWWSSVTKTQYDVAAQCFADQIGDVTFGPYDVESNYLSMTKTGAEVAELVIPEVSGIRDAYQGLQDWISIHNTTRARLPGFNMTDEQAFFLAYAQTNCYARRDRMTWNLLHTGLIPEDSRVNLALSHVEEFTNAFQCATDSGMVAKKLCRVF